MSFGNKLKNLRKNKNISQEDFASKIGVTRSSVGNYETNRNMPTAEILEKISNVLDCSIDYLLDKTDAVNKVEEFKFAYHKETEGLSEEDVKEALRIYKEIKYGKEKE